MIHLHITLRHHTFSEWRFPPPSAASTIRPPQALPRSWKRERTYDVVSATRGNPGFPTFGLSHFDPFSGKISSHGRFPPSDQICGKLPLKRDDSASKHTQLKKYKKLVVSTQLQKNYPLPPEPKKHIPPDFGKFGKPHRLICVLNIRDWDMDSFPGG